jgi:hypothetical protein
MFSSEDVLNNIGICSYKLMKKFKNDKPKNYFDQARKAFEDALSLNATALKLKKGERGRNWCSLLFLAKLMILNDSLEPNNQYKDSLKLLKDIKEYADGPLPTNDAFKVKENGSLNSLQEKYFSCVVSYKNFFLYSRLYLADVYLLQKRYKKAITYYRELTEKYSRSSLPRKLEGKLIDCIEALEGSEGIIKYYLESRDDFMVGFAHYQQGNYKDAIKFLKYVQKGRHKEDHPNTKNFYLANKYITQSYIALDDYETALKVYKKESEKFKDTVDIDLYWNIGENFASKKKL